jgi:hypothetical protein
MAGQDESIHILTAQLKVLDKQRQDVVDELETLKRSRLLAGLSSLTKMELLDLRRTLTVLGQTLSTDLVVSGYVQLVHEEPAEGKKYSIRMGCRIVESPIGLRYEVHICTTNEDVKMVVRTMLTSNDTRDEQYYEEYGVDESERPPRNIWDIDWDFTHRIGLVGPLSAEDHYTECLTR